MTPIVNTRKWLYNHWSAQINQKKGSRIVVFFEDFFGLQISVQINGKQKMRKISFSIMTN